MRSTRGIPSSNLRPPPNAGTMHSSQYCKKSVCVALLCHMFCLQNLVKVIRDVRSFASSECFIRHHIRCPRCPNCSGLGSPRKCQTLGSLADGLIQQCAESSLAVRRTGQCQWCGGGDGGVVPPFPLPSLHLAPTRTPSLPLRGL